MANVLHFTEQFNNAYWAAFNGGTVTANSHAAPAFAGGQAGLADTVNDTTSEGSAASLFGTYESIPSDSSDWVASIYIRKDAVTTRFVRFGLQVSGGGTPVISEVSFNTSTGETANGANPPTAHGSVDVDATWWRLWLRHPNNGSGNNLARVYINPAYSTTLGGGEDGGTISSIVAWGVNLTHTSTLDTYEPEPLYSFITLTLAGRAVLDYGAD